MCYSLLRAVHVLHLSPHCLHYHFFPLTSQLKKCPLTGYNTTISSYHLLGTVVDTITLHRINCLPWLRCRIILNIPNIGLVFLMDKPGSSNKLGLNGGII